MQNKYLVLAVTFLMISGAVAQALDMETISTRCEEERQSLEARYKEELLWYRKSANKIKQSEADLEYQQEYLYPAADAYIAKVLNDAKEEIGRDTKDFYKRLKANKSEVLERDLGKAKDVDLIFAPEREAHLNKISNALEASIRDNANDGKSLDFVGGFVGIHGGGVRQLLLRRESAKNLTSKVFSSEVNEGVYEVTDFEIIVRPDENNGQALIQSTLGFKNKPESSSEQSRRWVHKLDALVDSEAKIKTVQGTASAPPPPAPRPAHAIKNEKDVLALVKKNLPELCVNVLYPKQKPAALSSSSERNDSSDGADEKSRAADKAN